MAGARIVEDGEYYLVYAGGRTYRLPKRYVEPIGDGVALVSKKTGYMFKATSNDLQTLPPLKLKAENEI